MDISKDDAERLSQIAEVLAANFRTAKRLPVADSIEFVLDGQKIVVTLSASEPAPIMPRPG